MQKADIALHKNNCTLHKQRYEYQLPSFALRTHYSSFRRAGYYSKHESSACTLTLEIVVGKVQVGQCGQVAKLLRYRPYKHERGKTSVGCAVRHFQFVRFTHATRSAVSVRGALLFCSSVFSSLSSFKKRIILLLYGTYIVTFSVSPLIRVHPETYNHHSLA